MIYEKNAQILNMLKISKWSPTTQSGLKTILEDPMYKYNIEQYFNVIRNSINDIKDSAFYDESQIKTVGRYLITFYSALAQLPEGFPQSTTSNEESTLAKEILNDGNLAQEIPIKVSQSALQRKIINDYCEYLTELIDSKNPNIDEILNTIEKGLYGFISKDILAKLNIDLDLKAITRIYHAWLDVHEELCTLVMCLEKSLKIIHKDSWIRNVFDLSWVNESKELQEPVDIIVSFCRDLTKYDTSTQKVISACLYNTKSNYTFDNRKFGFMYKYRTDLIIAMSPSDAESATLICRDNDILIHCLFRGTPIESVARYYQASTLDLETIYDFNEFKEKTFKYNEILLKEEAKPYGMLIFREALEETSLQSTTEVRTCDLAKNLYEIVLHCFKHNLALFIREKDGRLKYIPATKIESFVKESIDMNSFVKML